MTMRFLSVCSGIEAASVAWEPLGFEAVGFCEIDKAAARLLAHRFPNVPNFGDFTKIDVQTIGRVDLLCGGTPCQAFSIAGNRLSLDDARGNLSLAFVALAHELVRFNGLRNVLWENVPGVLNTPDNAFGCFMGALVGADDALRCPTGEGWPNEGMVEGPRARLAWRVLDAQYFGLAQRRKRVFVVADFGNGADPAAVLFERQGLRGNTPPRRETRQGASAAAQAGAGVGFGGHCADIAPTLNAHFGDKQGLENQHIDGGCGLFVAQPVANTLGAKKDGGWRGDLDNDTYIAHSLRGEGFDASEDGTGRGTPIVPVTIAVDHVVGSMCAESGPNTHGSRGVSGSQTMLSGYIQPVAFAIQAGALRENPDSGPDGVGVQQDHAYTLEARAEVQAVAFVQNTRDEVRIFGEDGQTVGALAAEPGMKQQCYIAQAFDLRGREGGAQFEGPHDTANIRAASGGSSRSYVAQQWAVRRLTPTECERLQGFPDGHTLTPDAKGKMQADGPRYKQLGNSWAVPVVRWIGERLARGMA
jgi:DNA (cytosine-5)-methyltransferase 1